MRKLAWATRGVSAATGALLLGALMVPSAAASGGPAPEPEHGKKKCGPVARHVASAAPDFGSLRGTVFRLTTDRDGRAFLNDSRNQGVWIDLKVVPNTPKCVVDVAASVEESLGTLTLTLLSKSGVIYEARCTTSATAYSPTNLPGACGVGFQALQATPV
ncbi:hypothetical protein EF912_12710 [Streptomyces sp. WAC07061]|uniref:hypothetical protein n=1 Tax=Streptomyces sp. WAC07061 TaxID=2487410 RepID=UPI000F7B0F4B|nr:hypothetical protein [Streptomyces sp. WAC07061]RSS57902.1 hypothetical protein EF912_12710 [Streptomyces sp. WAC07061]